MAKAKYKVTAEKTYSRNARSLSAKITGTYTKGTVLTVYEQQAGEYAAMFGRLHKSKDKWVPMSSLSLVTSSETKKNTTSDVTTTEDDKESNQGVFSATENTDKVKNDTIYGTSNSSFTKLAKRYVKAFGSPPRFTEEVDPQYNNIKAISAGRSMLSTWYANPSILSICPGTVSYMPGFSKKDKNTLFNKIKDIASGDVGNAILSDNAIDGNGKLYEFRSAYASYINVVNLLARSASDLLGIGEVKDLIYGTTKPLNKFDYGYYTTPSTSGKADSLFSETKRSISTAVSDNAYIHFFCNQSGVSYSDSFSTSDEESILEEKLGGSSSLSKTRNNLQFLFGNVLTADAENDLSQVIQDAGDSDSFIGGLTTIAKNYIKGGNLVFPKIIAGSSYEKSIRCELSFSSVYGDRRSIFKYVILPALHLLALASPKQLSNNMYTYPFLVRCFEQGSMNCDLAYIHSLDFTRGGSDNTCWTVDGLPTEMNASFTITPLYSNMMVTSSKNPLMFMNNTALIEYLATMCGTDLKANNINVKFTLAKNAIANKVYDIPTVLQRSLVDSKLLNTVRDYMQIIN